MLTIVLRNIAFEGRHGATATERTRTRPFEVDVEIELDDNVGQTSDRLRDTLDYTHAAEAIVRLGTGEPHRLLESLSRRMLDALCALAPGARIRLELRKLAPPGCPGNPAWSAVRVEHG